MAEQETASPQIRSESRGRSLAGWGTRHLIHSLSDDCLKHVCWSGLAWVVCPEARPLRLDF